MLGVTELVLLVQVAGAAVVGTVRDRHTGEPLAGALVTLSDVDRSVSTDAAGRYAFDEVLAGPQHLSVEMLSYEARTLHALVAAAGRLEINISLQPNPIPLDPLAVEARLPVPGLDATAASTFPDRHLTIAAVRNHPMLSESDVFEAVAGGVVSVQPETPSGVHIRGGASDQTAYSIDGIPVFSPYHAAGMFSAWNPDALSGLTVSSSSSSDASLSGSVGATTRSPGSSLRGQGSLSTTQARVTVDGPLGLGGAGYLLSLRSGFAGGVTKPSEASRLRGETTDGLAKVEAKVGGGDLRILGYWSDNELDAAAVANASEPASPALPRNAFEWQSQSFGAEWRGPATGATWTVRAWAARGLARADWLGIEAGASLLDSNRGDEGVQAAAAFGGQAATTTIGTRLQRSRTAYRLTKTGGDPGTMDIAARTPTATAFVDHVRRVGAATTVELGLSATAAGGRAYPSPRLEVAWSPSPAVRLSGSASRMHQFAQSLRNPESIVGSIFPVDLYVGAGADEVPIARSDQAMIAAEYSPSAGLRLEAQVFTRDFDGLVLAALGTGEPFAIDGPSSGRGSATGLSLDAGYSTARLGVVASYGLQRVRLEADGTEYAPGRTATQTAQAGVTFFPGATSSIRLGTTGVFGRRTSLLVGGLEWEACNLLDLGCEFGGSPLSDPTGLGLYDLPAYVRIDLGLRKHWHVELASRDGLIGLFGTVTNVLGRTNLLTTARDPLTGVMDPISMRPFAPLVIGLDWRF